MIQKNSLLFLISGIASTTVSAAEIASIEYTGPRTEFAQEYAVLFGQEPCEVWKHNLGSSCSRYGGGNSSGSNGSGNKGNGSGNSGGGSKGGGNNGGNKGSGTKK